MNKQLLRHFLGVALACVSGATLAAGLVEQFASPVSDLNGDRYVIYSAGDFDNPIAWPAARDAAAGAGGYLATITSAGEEASLQDAFAGSRILVGVAPWIGLSDAAQEGTFRWVTGPEAGQPLGYADWLTGEPNNSGSTGNEDYVTWANYPWGPSGGACETRRGVRAEWVSPEARAGPESSTGSSSCRPAATLPSTSSTRSAPARGTTPAPRRDSPTRSFPKRR